MSDIEEKKLKISHLENICHDIRDEIKKRIKQRDNYSIQQIISLGVIAGVAFSKSEFIYVLLIAPPISIYFTMLIIYSYRLHDILTEYLREKIEKPLALLCDTPVENEFEIHYKKLTRPGIRRDFFVCLMWVVVISPLAYLWAVQNDEGRFNMALYMSTAVFGGAGIFLTILHKRSTAKYSKKYKENNKDHDSKSS